MFERKIIIGSVIGFAASIVGLVVAFFPSVFNLEKGRIQEKEIFVRTKQHMDELYDFLKQNENKPVKLTIGYCFNPERAYVESKNFVTRSESGSQSPSKFPLNEMLGKWFVYYDTNGEAHNYISKGDTYVDQIGTNKLWQEIDAEIEKAQSEKEKERIDLKAKSEFGMAAVGTVGLPSYGPEGSGLEGLRLENGSLAYRHNDIWLREINIPHSSEDGKKYIWVVGEDYDFHTFNSGSKIFDFKCPDNHYSPYAMIKGHFYVRPKENGSIFSSNYIYDHYEASGGYDGMGLGWERIQLEPLDRKELELKNY